MAQERRNVARQVRGRFEAELEPVRSTSPIGDPGLRSGLVSHRDDAHMGHARAGWCVLPDLERARSHYPNPRRRNRSRDGRARSVSPTSGWRVPPPGGRPPHAKSGPTSQWCRRWGSTPTAAHRNVRESR